MKWEWEVKWELGRPEHKKTEHTNDAAIEIIQLIRSNLNSTSVPYACLCFFIFYFAQMFSNRTHTHTSHSIRLFFAALHPSWFCSFIWTVFEFMLSHFISIQTLSHSAAKEEVENCCAFDNPLIWRDFGVIEILPLLFSLSLALARALFDWHLFYLIIFIRCTSFCLRPLFRYCCW